MAKNQTGQGRVTAFQLLHTWPDSYCVMAYTTTGHFGDTAVLGIIPVAGNGLEPGDLFAVAGRHDPTRLYGGSAQHARGAWLACLGFSARLTPKPESLDLADVAWSLDMVQRTELDKPLFGNSVVVAGRMTLATPEEMAAVTEDPRLSVADALRDTGLMKQARELLPPHGEALYGPVGQERVAS